jgi:hypothetical protein
LQGLPIIVRSSEILLESQFMLWIAQARQTPDQTEKLSDFGRKHAKTRDPRADA